VRLAADGARITRVVLDYELKRDYQRFLQESETAEEATEAQWRLKNILEALFPDAEISLRLHRLAVKGDPDAPSLFQRGVLITRRVGPFAVRREYLVLSNGESLGQTGRALPQRG
jgi:hypothetical protein